MLVEQQVNFATRVLPSISTFLSEDTQKPLHRAGCVPDGKANSQ